MIQTKQVTIPAINAISIAVFPDTTAIDNDPLPTLTAASRVFNTFELLDLILAKCNSYDLLTRLPRVSRIFNRVIANNKFIQHFLFFRPWGPYDYPKSHGIVNPFILLLEYKDSQGGTTYKEPIYDFGPGQDEDTDKEDRDDEQICEDIPGVAWDGDWPEPEIFYEFDWERIRRDEKFMYQNASWKRMFAIQPLKKEVWNILRPRSQMNALERCRKLKAKGRTLGEIFEDVLAQEANVDCLTTRTYIRTSDRYLAILAVDITLKPLGKPIKEVIEWDFSQSVEEAEGNVNQEDITEESALEVEDNTDEEDVADESAMETEENVNEEEFKKESVFLSSVMPTHWLSPREKKFWVV